MLDMLGAEILQYLRIINIAKAVGRNCDVLLQAGKHIGYMCRTLFEAFIFFRLLADIKIAFRRVDKRNRVECDIGNAAELGDLSLQLGLHGLKTGDFLREKVNAFVEHIAVGGR